MVLVRKNTHTTLVSLVIEDDRINKLALWTLCTIPVPFYSFIRLLQCWRATEINRFDKRDSKIRETGSEGMTRRGNERVKRDWNRPVSLVHSRASSFPLIQSLSSPCLSCPICLSRLLSGIATTRGRRDFQRQMRDTRESRTFSAKSRQHGKFIVCISGDTLRAISVVYGATMVPPSWAEHLYSASSEIHHC